MAVGLDENLTQWVGCYSQMNNILELLLRKHGKCRHCLAQKSLHGVGGKAGHSDSLASEIWSRRGMSAMTKKRHSKGLS